MESVVDPPEIPNIKNIDFHANGIKILGNFFSFNKDLFYKNNLQRVLNNFNTILSLWKTRSLTLFGKIQVLKSLAIPKLYYVSTKTCLSDHFIKSVESSITDFIWNGKKPKIKRNTLIGDYNVGGLKLPDFKLMIKSARVKQAIKLITSEQVSPILSKYLNNIGGLKCIGENFDISRIPSFLPAFYKDVFTEWADFALKDPSANVNEISKQSLWNNHYLKINDKSIFYQDFSVIDINKVSDLCNEKGDFKWGAF